MLRKIRKIIGVILIASGLFSIIREISLAGFSKIDESLQLANFFKYNTSSMQATISKNEYIMVLEIPKINLKKGLYHPESLNNDVDKNISIIKESTMPNQENSHLILASHSGNSKASYFKKLDQISVNDSIYIYYNESKYEYIVNNIKEIEKTGYLEIPKKVTTNLLTLITCKPNVDDKQIVVEAFLENVTKY